MTRCRRCGAALPDSYRRECWSCDERPASEQLTDRMDYWMQILQDSAEGSGVRAIAKRMAAKYDAKVLFARIKEKRQAGDT